MRKKTRPTISDWRISDRKPYDETCSDYSVFFLAMSKHHDTLKTLTVSSRHQVRRLCRSLHCKTPRSLIHPSTEHAIHMVNRLLLLRDSPRSNCRSRECQVSIGYVPCRVLLMALLLEYQLCHHTKKTIMIPLESSRDFSTPTPSTPFAYSTISTQVHPIHSAPMRLNAWSGNDRTLSSMPLSSTIVLYCSFAYSLRIFFTLPK